MNLDGYREWLVSEGYQPSTVDTTVRKLTRLFHFEAERTNGHARPHLQRYLRYVKDTKRNPLGQDFQAALLKEGFKASSKRSKPGARNKKLLTASQLTALHARLRTRGHTGRVAALYVQSKLQVGEFLVLDLAGARDRFDGFVDGTWVTKAFVGYRATLLWQLIAESKRAAYKKLLDLVRAEDTDLDTIYRSKVQQV